MSAPDDNGPKMGRDEWTARVTASVIGMIEHQRHARRDRPAEQTAAWMMNTVAGGAAHLLRRKSEPFTTHDCVTLAAALIELVVELNMEAEAAGVDMKVSAAQ